MTEPESAEHWVDPKLDREELEREAAERRQQRSSTEDGDHGVG